MYTPDRDVHMRSPPGSPASAAGSTRSAVSVTMASAPPSAPGSILGSMPTSRAHTPKRQALGQPTRHAPGERVNYNGMRTPNPQADSDLLRLPAELLHKVLTDLGTADPTGLATVASVCRDLHAFVYNNPDSALWRNVLLSRYDDPRLAGGGHKASKDVAWRARVQDRAFLEKVFGNSTLSIAGPATTSYDCTGSRAHNNSFGGTGSILGMAASAQRGRDLAPHLDRICKALLELYLDLPARDPSTEDTGPQSFFAAPPTRNGPFLNRTLRSEAFNRMYLELLTHPAPSKSTHDPVAVRTRSNSLHTLLNPVPSSSTPRSPSNRYVPPHALPLDPTLAYPLKNPLCVTGNPTLARLHALVPAELDADVPSHRQHRGYLRELVYGKRHYRADNDYGPLNPDGTVDWHLVNAIGTVMMLNAIDVLALGEENWRPSVAPMSNGVEAVRGLGFGNLSRPPDLAEDEVWDWAGVGGQWFGSYAFLDYADWVFLNEPQLRRRVEVHTLDLSRYLEAVGDLMEVTLTASHDPDAASAAFSAINGTQITLPPLDTPLPISHALPPVYFYGRSQNQNGIVQSLSSFVRGVARLTTDDPPEVRWTLVIRYSGEDRWKIEGVQVGGRQSRRGFFGIWTDAAKEAHSPNGPIWYWKKETKPSETHPPPPPPNITNLPAVVVLPAGGANVLNGPGAAAGVAGGDETDEDEEDADAAPGADAVSN